MSEEAVVIESAAPPEVQAEAEKMGWIPPIRYKGDPDRFVDADAFVERGKTVLPIVTKQLRETREQLAATNTLAAETARALKQAQDAIADMELRHSAETARKVEQARKDTKAALAAASEAGDHAAVAELTEQMTELTAAAGEVVEKKEEKKDDPPPEFKPPADMLEWQADNDWYGTNRKKTALFLACAQDLRDGGDGRKGKAFFDAAKVEMEKELGLTHTPVDKTDGGRHEGGGETRGRGGKGYAALPSDAKAQCDADAKGRVGKGKRHETIESWRKTYADIYFKE